MKGQSLLPGSLLVCAVILLAYPHYVTSSTTSDERQMGLNILSFNIRQFGIAKYEKQSVVDILIDIVKDYDLIFVIELVDPSLVVLPGFVSQLNKPDVVRVIDTFQYVDTSNIFQRPPFSIYIEAFGDRIGELPPFFIIVIHTQPTDTANEIDGLATVFDIAASYFSTPTGMILGDLNADCSYLSNTRYYQLDLYTNTSFTWWIDKDADTTSGASDCAYDRIITSASLSPYVVNGSVGIVDFDRIYDLTADFTASVSDHYPVNITLEGKAVGVASIVQCSVVLGIVNVILACLFIV